MGREIRRIPIGWNHPRDEDGYFIPLLDQTLEEAIEIYEECANGDCESDPRQYPETYRDPWPADAVFGYCYYECTSEGTPISPVFATKEDLIRWFVKERGWSEDETIDEEIEPGKPLYL